MFNLDRSAIEIPDKRFALSGMTGKSVIPGERSRP